MIDAAGPGGEVRLLADKGTYKVTQQISISAGGEAGAPVTIRGISSSGQPMAATFVGTRATDWKPGLAEGNELFRLLSGANHLKFMDLAVKNFGNGVFRIGANISDLAISRVSATNVTRFIENYVSGTASSASVNGLRVEDITISGYSKNAIRLQYNSSNILIEDVIGDSQRQNGGLIMAGVMLMGTVHDVVLRRVTMKNNYGRGSSGEYWNGDGFLTERGVYNVRFEYTAASGNTDAGYDLKSSNTTLVGATASGNNLNFKFWGENVTMTDSVSSNPVHYGGIGKVAHLQLASGANVALDGFRYSDTSGARVFDLSNGSNVLRLVDTPVPALSRMHLGNNSLVKLPTGVIQNGTSGADMLAGSAGTDTLIGGKGNDTYIVDASGDRPMEQGTEGIDLVKTTLSSYTLPAHVEKLQYIGSASLTTALSAASLAATGDSAGFTATGNSLDNTITGGPGNDRLWGGAGDDTLTGGGGADTYVFGLGDKKDTIYNRDSGAADKLLFKAGITADELWFAQTGSDLLVTVRGTGGTDRVLIKGWYSDSSNRLSEFELSDGTVLEASRVQQLVTAMAAFTTSSGTPETMTAIQAQSVENTVAANWESA